MLVRVSNIINYDIEKLLPRIDRKFLGQSLWSPEKRPQKEFTRYLVATLSDKDKKSLFVMPAGHGRDVQYLKSIGVSSKNAHWHVCEQDYSILDNFKRKAAPTIIGADSVSYYNSRFADIYSFPHVDFAWFDLLSTFGWDDVYFFRDRLIVSKNLDLFFTLSLTPGRRNAITTQPFRMLKECFSSEHVIQAFGLNEDIIYWLSLEDVDDSSNLEDDPATVLVPGEFPASTISSPVSGENKFDEAINVYSKWFSYFFPGHSFDTSVYIYSDSANNTFGLFHLSKFHPRSMSLDSNDKIDEFIELREMWANGANDSVITSNLGIPEKNVKIWRSALGIQEGEKDKEEKFKESLFKLLVDTEERKTANLSSILKSRTQEFFKEVSQMSGNSIRYKYSATHVTISSPVSEYRININASYNSSSIVATNSSRSLSLPRQFAYESNKIALFSVFRLAFLGDPYLHPQLCGYAYNNCFIWSDPQREAIMAWRESYSNGDKGGIIVLPTGMGKTKVALNILGLAFKKKRSLFVSHRSEIVEQACSRFLEIYPENERETLCLSKGSVSRRLVKIRNMKHIFITIQSLEKYVSDLDPKSFDFIIFDEFHHVRARTWEETVFKFLSNRSKDSYVLGLTATPFRTDEKSVGEILDYNYLYKYSLGEALWKGYLTTPKFFLYSDIDEASHRRLLASKNMKGRFLEERNKTWTNIFRKKHWDKHSGRLKTVVFCGSEAEAVYWTNTLNKSIRTRGFNAAKYTASDSNREDILDDFKIGEVTCLITVQLFDEGVDIPDIDCVMFFVKSESTIKNIQRIGRGLRLSPGKREVQVIDFLSNYDSYEKIVNLSAMMGAEKSQISQIVGNTGGSSSKEQESLAEIMAIELPGTVDFQTDLNTNFIITNVTNTAIDNFWTNKKNQAIKLRRQNERMSPAEISSVIKAPVKKVIEWVGWGGTDVSRYVNILSEYVKKFSAYPYWQKDTKIRDYFIEVLEEEESLIALNERQRKDIIAEVLRQVGI